MACISDQEKEDKLLLARIEDAVYLCRLRKTDKFVGFLDERQYALVRQKFERDVSVCFFGGYAQAQRVFFGIFDSEPAEKAFPIVSMLFEYRMQAQLTHRDFLGTFMATGICREAIGDILCDQGRTLVFVDAAVAPFLLAEIQRVGGEGVKITSPFTGEWEHCVQTEQYQDTVASLRLDAVLRVMLRHSRTQAVQYVQAGLVSVNHQLCTSPAHLLREGDIVSVKKNGRYTLQTVGNCSKKGRIFITVSKFI